MTTPAWVKRLFEPVSTDQNYKSIVLNLSKYQDINLEDWFVKSDKPDVPSPLYYVTSSDICLKIFTFLPPLCASLLCRGRNILGVPNHTSYIFDFQAYVKYMYHFGRNEVITYLQPYMQPYKTLLSSPEFNSSEKYDFKKRCFDPKIRNVIGRCTGLINSFSIHGLSCISLSATRQSCKKLWLYDSKSFEMADSVVDLIMKETECTDQKVKYKIFSHLFFGNFYRGFIPYSFSGAPPHLEVISKIFERVLGLEEFKKQLALPVETGVGILGIFKPIFKAYFNDYKLFSGYNSSMKRFVHANHFTSCLERFPGIWLLERMSFIAFPVVLQPPPSSSMTCSFSLFNYLNQYVVLDIHSANSHQETKYDCLALDKTDDNNLCYNNMLQLVRYFPMRDSYTKDRADIYFSLQTILKYYSIEDFFPISEQGEDYNLGIPPIFRAIKLAIAIVRDDDKSVFTNFGFFSSETLQEILYLSFNYSRVRVFQTTLILLTTNYNSINSKLMSDVFSKFTQHFAYASMEVCLTRFLEFFSPVGFPHLGVSQWCSPLTKMVRVFANQILPRLFDPNPVIRDSLDSPIHVMLQLCFKLYSIHPPNQYPHLLSFAIMQSLEQGYVILLRFWLPKCIKLIQTFYTGHQKQVIPSFNSDHMIENSSLTLPDENTPHLDGKCSWDSSHIKWVNATNHRLTSLEILAQHGIWSRESFLFCIEYPGALTVESSLSSDDRRVRIDNLLFFMLHHSKPLSFDRNLLNQARRYGFEKTYAFYALQYSRQNE